MSSPWSRSAATTPVACSPPNPRSPSCSPKRFTNCLVFSALPLRSLRLCVECLLPRYNQISMVETIHPGASAPGARTAVFDFDGTVSLIRAGWVEIMVPMMIEVLTALDTGKSPADLRHAVEPFICRLTGKDTIYQMIALAEQVTLRGGTPLDPDRKNVV